MYPTLLDINTGKTVVAENMDGSVFWWAEGNGSCDCNRSIAMGEKVENEMTELFGEGSCFGCTRIVAIDVHGDLEGLTEKEVLQQLNRKYRDELRQHWDKTLD